MEDRIWRDLVETIAQNGPLVAKLVDVHRPDNEGRCRVCTVAGTTRHAAWPCTIARLAKDAVVEQHRGSGGPPR